MNPILSENFNVMKGKKRSLIFIAPASSTLRLVGRSKVRVSSVGSLIGLLLSSGLAKVTYVVVVKNTTDGQYVIQGSRDVGNGYVLHC